MNPAMMLMRAVQMFSPGAASLAGGSAVPAAPAAPHLGDNPQAVAQNVVRVLHAAMGSVNDPIHQAAYANALGSLTKLLAQNEKEHQQALAGKLSPRLMSRAYGRG